jgi:tyrosyl-tRNA synthetase
LGHKALSLAKCNKCDILLDMAVITDKEKINGVLERGVKKIIEKDSLEKKLSSGRVLRVKHGVDPTTSDLHLGYAVVYRKLKQLQDLGHKIVFLVGDFTGRFGDPTEKSEGPRVMRSKKEVEKLAKNYIDQVSKILDIRKVEVRYNGEWYDKMSAEDLLRLMSHFTTAQMMRRDMFKERAKKGLDVGLHEPAYPVLQAYDSVELKSDITVIGSDQEFNELAARELQKDFGQDQQDIMIMPLLVGIDGKMKMSQSLNNYIGIAERPDCMHGKLMSIQDNLMEEYFTLLTDLEFCKSANPRDEKMRLAREIVKIYHGEEEARKAEEKFIKTFQKKEIPEDIKEVRASEGERLGDILLQEKLVSSKSDFRRLVGEGAVDFNGEPINDIYYKVGGKGTVKVGKRRFLKILLVDK